AVDGRHFNLRAQRGFCGSHRNSDIDIIAVATKHGMIPGANAHVQIAGLAPACARISLPRDPDPLSVTRAGLDANFERLGATYHAFAVAHRTNRNILASSAASRTRYVELHAVGALLDRPFTVALRANTRLLDVAAAMAIAADILARDVQPHHSAADRRPERHVHLVFEIAARLRPLLRRSSASTAAKHAGEDVAETSTSSAAALATTG